MLWNFINRPHNLISTDFSLHFQWMVFVIYTQRGNQLLYYNLLCLLLYPFWGLETTLCHRTHWSPDFLWIRVAPVWFYSKFIWIKGLNIRYTLILHSNAIPLASQTGSRFFKGKQSCIYRLLGVHSIESQCHKRLCKSVRLNSVFQKGTISTENGYHFFTFLS
jgi:hypothetical protein